MLERIRSLMEYKRLSPSQFADEVEVPRAVISHILSGRNKPSLDVVLKIIHAHRDISLQWLLMDEGEMLTDLVATNQADTATDAPAFIPEAPPAQVLEKVVRPEKVQNHKPAAAPQAEASPAEKQVEQIIIFYTDKTCTAYKAI